MKKAVLSIVFALSSITLVQLSSCGNKEQKSSETSPETEKQHYQCPMKCTEEVFDKPGKCPVCEMELEKISNS